MKYLTLIALISSSAQAALVSEWANDQCNYVNCSYLSDTKVVDNDFNTQLLGGFKKVAEIRQHYQDQMRNHESASVYSTSQALASPMSTTSNPLYSEILGDARDSQTKTYADNLNKANNEGDFSQPVQYTGAAIAGLMGKSVSAKVVDGFKINTRLDMRSQQASMGIESIIGKFDCSYTPRGNEIYSLNASSKFPVAGVITGFNYVGTSKVSRASIARSIWKFTAEIDNIWGSPMYGIPSEAVYRVNYGMAF